MERWRGEADEPVEQRESVEAAEESGDFWDDILAGEAAAIEAGEITDWDLSEAEELEPEKTYRGGRYRDLPGEAGLDRHHLVAKKSLEQAGMNSGDGAAIQIGKADHRSTASWGKFKDAKKFRDDQTALLLAGQQDRALDLGVQDVLNKFPGKYDDAVQEAIDATRDT